VSSNSNQGTILITSPDQNGTKISLASESSESISGICSQPGWSVVILGAASGTTSCLTNGTWSLTLNFSPSPDGLITISAFETNGSLSSNPTTRSFVKDTAYCLTNSANAPFAGGAGTVPSPYLICTTTQALNLSNTPADWGDNFQLKNDIDLTGQSWTPVNMTAKFDGNGFKMMNLTINSPATNDIGLFGSLSGTAENLGVSNGNITGNQSVGLLSGTTVGSIITNCYTTGQVTATGFHVGGLVGDGTSTISNSWSSATVTDAGSGGGGLVGDATGGSISNSYATGGVSITSGGNSRIGGLAGASSAAISNSYATGAVSAAGDSSVGGLVGQNTSTIVTSYATGGVSGAVPVGGANRANFWFCD
jgi:hypothetical protein